MNTTNLRRRVVHGLAVVLVLVAGSGVPTTSAVDAGGWAVGTLDAVPSPHAGDVATIGFTILQHGATPIHPEGDVGVAIEGPDGASYTEAVADASPGHYTAIVGFPVAGTYTWHLRMGWFADQDLGTLVVSPSVADRSNTLGDDSAASEAVVALVRRTSAIASWATFGWIGHAGTSSLIARTAGVVAPGQDIFRSKGCSTCHLGPGVESLVQAGPSLVDVASRAGDRRPGLSAREYLVESIREPSAFLAAGYGAGGAFIPTEVGRSPMPLLPLSEAELDAVVDFLLGS